MFQANAITPTERNVAHMSKQIKITKSIAPTASANERGGILVHPQVRGLGIFCQLIAFTQTRESETSVLLHIKVC